MHKNKSLITKNRNYIYIYICYISHKRLIVYLTKVFFVYFGWKNESKDQNERAAQTITTTS